MIKWNYFKIKSPKENQEVIFIADKDCKDHVRFGIYREGKFYGTLWDYKEIYKLSMDSICWAPMPKSKLN